MPYGERCLVIDAPFYQGSASRPLGLLAATIGRFDAAARHFEDALAMNTKIRSPLWVFEVVGLALVFIELAVIRSHEFGVPPPWARFAGRILRLLRRSQVVNVQAAVSVASGLEARAKVQPGPAPDEATEQQRIERLERYVERLDEDLDDMWQTIGRRADQMIMEAARRDEELRREVEQREADRRAKLRPSLIRQALGATFVLIGLVPATLGSLL